MDQILLIGADVIHHSDAVVHGLGHKADMLFLGLGAVGAGGGENQHVLIPDAGMFQLLHENGDIGLRRLPAAGHIGDDDAHGLAGLDQLPQGGGINGMVQRIADVLRHGPLGQVHMIGLHLGCNLLRGQVNLKRFGAVLHSFCHCLYFLSDWCVRMVCTARGFTTRKYNAVSGKCREGRGRFFRE